jgi:CheY-like chemotaxis protein
MEAGVPIKAVSDTHDRIILMADDDLDYHLIVKCALEEVGFRGVLQEVRDGAELMDFLHRRGKYKNATAPDLIILDLNMP